jgi:hypothetical protein
MACKLSVSQHPKKVTAEEVLEEPDKTKSLHLRKPQQETERQAISFNPIKIT